MPSLLSASQQRVFNWVEDFIAQHGISPTYREIQKGLGYKSASTVKKHVDRLIDQGFVDQHPPRKARSIRILKPSRSIPLLGAIAAHSLVETFPDAEVEHITLSCLPKFAAMSRHELSQHFALRVRGDSMIGALIDDDDVVILKRESDPRAIRNGTVIAARVNGATTLKHFYRSNKSITLRPANPKYEPTTIDATLETVDIQGIYVGVLRGVL